jgi:hypothetical protein
MKRALISAILRRVVLTQLAAIPPTLVACGGETTHQPTLAGGISAAGTNAGFPYDCPANAPCCSCTVGGGGTCTCAGHEMFPGCLATAHSFLACSQLGKDCMSCQFGAGYMCSCRSDLDGGLQWLCIGTEYACTGGF